MRDGWRLTTVGEVCEIVNGGTPKTDIADYWSGHHLWITPAEMGKRTSPYVANTARKLTDLGLDDCSARLLPPLSVILSSRAPIGHLVINTEFMATNQGCKGLVPCKSLDHKFLFYYLSSIVDLLNDLGTGTTFKEISGGKLKEVPLLLPPLLEQKRIAAILDDAFEGIAKAFVNAEMNLFNVRALFESYLEGVFSKGGKDWVEKPIGSVCDLLGGFAFKSGDAVPTSRTQLLRMGNLYKNKLNLDRNPVFYPEQFALIHKRYLLKENDLIMSLTGTTGKEDYGFTVRMPKCDHNILMNQRIVRFEGIKSNIINIDYFYYYLRSRKFLNTLYATAKGTRQANLSSVTVKKLPLLLPALCEQEKIAAALDETAYSSRSLEIIYLKKIDHLADLKQAILHKAFAGELTARSGKAVQEAAE